VVADAFSRLCDRRLSFDADADDEAGTPMDALASLGDSSPPPVTTEPSILPLLRTEIEAIHNSTSGHFGADYTRKLLLSIGVSDDGLRRHVAKLMRDCPVCQLRSAINRQIKTHCFTTTSYTPMKVLNIDTIDPVDRDSADNCYILVVIDCFTRFVELLYPVSDNTSALPCARALLSHACRYGTPMTIRSDRGTQFVNRIIKELLNLLQVEHEVSLAYSKEYKAIV
jgi:hypothetical protein